MALQDILPNGMGGSSSGLSDVLGSSPDAASGGAFERQFKKSNFDSGVQGDVVDTDFRTIASYEVPAGTEIRFGSGSAENEANQGYLYVLIEDSTPEEIEGTLRLSYATTTGRGTVVVQDFNADNLHGSKSDRTLKVPLPEQVDKRKIEENERLLVQFQTDSGTATVDDTETEVDIPVTEYDLTVDDFAR